MFLLVTDVIWELAETFYENHRTLFFIMYLGWKLKYLQVREQTNKRRQEISASLTTYGSATPQKAAIDTSPTSSTSGSAKASNPSNENTSSDTTTSTNASEASSSAASEK